MQTLPNGLPRYRAEERGGYAYRIWDRREGRVLLDVPDAHTMERVLFALNHAPDTAPAAQAGV